MGRLIAMSKVCHSMGVKLPKNVYVQYPITIKDELALILRSKKMKYFYIKIR